MFAPVFICDVFYAQFTLKTLASRRGAGLINISYLTLRASALYSRISDDGRGDLRQLAPRKICAKSFREFSEALRRLARGFSFALSRINNVAI
jgi:hypothetical protein